MPQPLPNQPSGSAVVKVAAVILAVLAVVVGVAIWLVQAWNAQPVKHWPVEAERTLPAHLETAPQPALAAYLEEKNRLLNSYAWVDRDAGVARVPVELAMRALAAGVSPSGGLAAQEREASRPAAAPYLRGNGPPPRTPSSPSDGPSASQKETSP